MKPPLRIKHLPLLNYKSSREPIHRAAAKWHFRPLDSRAEAEFARCLQPSSLFTAHVKKFREKMRKTEKQNIYTRIYQPDRQPLGKRRQAVGSAVECRTSGRTN
jgi:hypothetical protein